MVRSKRGSASFQPRPLPVTAVARVRRGVPRVERPGGVEVAVEVLLARQHGAPRGGAAGAVVHRAEHATPRRVGAGPESGVACRRTVDLEAGVHGDAAVQPRAADRHRPPRSRPGAAPDLHDRHPVRGHRDLLDRDVVVQTRREHQLLVGVLVVHHEQRPVAGQRQHAHVVAVVAELLRRGLGALAAYVEGRRVREHRVTPTHHDVAGEAVRGGHLVGDVRRHRREVGGAQGRSLRTPGRSGARGGRGCGGGLGQPGDDERAGTGLENGAAGHGSGDDVLDVRVPRRVRDRLVARVAAAVLAGQVATRTMGTCREQGEKTTCHVHSYGKGAYAVGRDSRAKADPGSTRVNGW